MSNQVKQYWRKSLNMTGILLGIWFLITFVMLWFAEPLSSINFLGWPLSFYLAAQGAQLVYLGIIWYYAKHMSKLDKEYGFDEGGTK